MAFNCCPAGLMGLQLFPFPSNAMGQSAPNFPEANARRIFIH
jgi:hypothetical protein